MFSQYKTNFKVYVFNPISYGVSDALAPRYQERNDFWPHVATDYLLLGIFSGHRKNLDRKLNTNSHKLPWFGRYRAHLLHTYLFFIGEKLYLGTNVQWPYFRWPIFSGGQGGRMQEGSLWKFLKLFWIISMKVLKGQNQIFFTRF